jgi:hypothetical protein
MTGLTDEACSFGRQRIEVWSPLWASAPQRSSPVYGKAPAAAARRGQTLAAAQADAGYRRLTVETLPNSNEQSILGDVAPWGMPRSARWQLDNAPAQD